jgi:hypothetical protein
VGEGGGEEEEEEEEVEENLDAEKKEGKIRLRQLPIFLHTKFSFLKYFNMAEAAAQPERGGRGGFG